MDIIRRHKFYSKNRRGRNQNLTRLLLADILPTILLLLAMAFGMAYVAHKAAAWPPLSERATALPVSVIIG